MKIAVITSLPAEGNMDVDTGHLKYFKNTVLLSDPDIFEGI
jgi:hypothetical protein